MATMLRHVSARDLQFGGNDLRPRRRPRAQGAVTSGAPCITQCTPTPPARVARAQGSERSPARSGTEMPRGPAPNPAPPRAVESKSAHLPRRVLEESSPPSPSSTHRPSILTLPSPNLTHSTQLDQSTLLVSHVSYPSPAPMSMSSRLFLAPASAAKKSTATKSLFGAALQSSQGWPLCGLRTVMDLLHIAPLKERSRSRLLLLLFPFLFSL